PAKKPDGNARSTVSREPRATSLTGSGQGRRRPISDRRTSRRGSSPDHHPKRPAHRRLAAPMLLTITTTTRPATDLGFLLHKNPAAIRTVALSFGKAHV